MRGNSAENCHAQSFHYPNAFVRKELLLQVSTEGPRFRTLAVDSVMVVIHLPLHPPTLTVSTQSNDEKSIEKNNVKEEYNFEIGASLTVHCTSDLSYPRPNISIFFNNILLTEQNSVCYKDESFKNGFLQNRRVLVDFHLKEDLLGLVIRVFLKDIIFPPSFRKDVNMKFELKCISQLYDMNSQFSWIKFALKEPGITNNFLTRFFEEFG